MGKVLRRVLIVVLAIAIVAGAFGYKYLTSRTIYNDGRINGNNASNLYGEGLFCEQGGKVFFSNPFDEGSLYVMNVDESDVHKLSSDRAYYINADDNYIYFSRNNNIDESQMAFLNVATNALCRIDRSGKNIKVLDDAACMYSALIGNKVYYMHYDNQTMSTLYSVGIDGKDKEQVASLPIDARGALGHTIYYSGIESDHNLYALDTDSGNISRVYSGNIWQPVVDNNYLYAIDLDNSYSLIRVDLSTSTVDVLSESKVFEFNKYGDYIFYQDMGDEAAFRCLDLSTGADDIVVPGNYNSINVTSKYVYFKDFNTQAMYHSIYGNGIYNASVFNPGVDIDIKKKK